MQWNCIEAWSRMYLKRTHEGEVKIIGLKWRITESIQDKIEIAARDETQEGITLGLWSWFYI